MKKRIAVLGSYDTKGEVLCHLAARVGEKGCVPVLVDTSLGGETDVETDVTSGVIAEAGGGSIAEIRRSEDTGSSTRVMVRGASKIVAERVRRGVLQGIVAVGGASNTGLATEVMGTLPFGLPKVMVSSMAAVPAYAGSYFGTKDLTMIHSVVDIAGLNPLLESILGRAAAAVCGMVEEGSGTALLGPATRSRPRVAVTEFKFSDRCCRRATRLLQEWGAEVIAFHAQGIGDRAMEELIEEGQIDGVLDIVPGGVSEEILGGNRAAGPHRLEAAGAAGIPQVVTPCGFDMLSAGPLERGDRDDPLWVSRQLSKRKIFIPDALRVQVRTSAEELLQIADAVVGKLNRSRGATCLVVPTQGWSSLSEEGKPLCDFEADGVFVERLRGGLADNVSLKVVDLPLNCDEFAGIAVAELTRHLEVPTTVAWAAH